MIKKLNICFISLGAYPLLKGNDIKRIVGPDVHQVTLAKELVKQGFEVSVITYGTEFFSIEYIDGMKILKVCNSCHRIKVINLLIKIIAIWNAMIKSESDLFFHAGGASGVTSIFSKILMKKYIYEIASDAQVNKNVIIRKNKQFNKSFFTLNSFGNWLDIKIAEKVIVQSIYQKTYLKSNFKVDGILIKLPFQISESKLCCKEKTPIVLWVGSMAEVKQPELFLEIARRFPKHKFQMIGGPSGNEKMYNTLKENAEKIRNLSFLGVIPLNEIDYYFSKASVLINTSMFEGFPHAFIQAWMHHMPVISLNADPDELICEKRLGLHSKSFDQLLHDLEKLLNNKSLREELGINGRKYVEIEHNIMNNINKYIEVFEQSVIN